MTKLTFAVSIHNEGVDFLKEHDSLFVNHSHLVGSKPNNVDVKHNREKIDSETIKSILEKFKDKLFKEIYDYISTKYDLKKDSDLDKAKKEVSTMLDENSMDAFLVKYIRKTSEEPTGENRGGVKSSLNIDILSNKDYDIIEQYKKDKNKGC